MSATAKMRMQERDLQLLNDLSITTVMTTEHIRRRFFAADTTGKACLRRLRMLRGAQMIRPVGISDFDPAAHARTIYRLSMQGYAYLAARGEAPGRFLAGDPKPQMLAHRLAIGRVVLSLIDSCRQLGFAAPVWILEQDPIEGAPQDQAKLPIAQRFVLAEDFEAPGGELIRCRPDAASLLRLPQAADTPLELVSYWEIDRSTETHGQFLAEKLAPYFALVQSRRYMAHWRDRLQTATPTVRIFFVFKSEERLQNIAGRIAAEPGALYGYPVKNTLTDEQKKRAADFIEATFRLCVAADAENPRRLLADRIWASPAKVSRADRRQIYRAPARVGQRQG